MIYRRVLPVAASVAAIAGGLFTLNQSSISFKYNGSRLNDHGLKNYTFLDSRKFELINVSILTRHGARTPNYYIDSKYDMPDWDSGVGYVPLLPDLCYQTDVKELPSNNLIDEETIQEEYIEHNKGKCLFGQLTLIGQEQAIAFGNELRRIYMNGYKFLNDEFDENEILCRSTKFPRTFFTLKGILSGIYGIESFDMCHRPIIYTKSIATDSMYPNPAVCSVIGSFVKVGSVSIAKDDDIIKMKCLLKKLLGVENLKFSSPDVVKEKSDKCEKDTEPNDNDKDDDNMTVYAVRDDLYSRQVHNFEVPNAFTTLFPEMNRLSSQEVLYEYLGGSSDWEEKMAILVSPAFTFIKENMRTVLNDSLLEGTSKPCLPEMKDSVIKKKNKMKMQILSCHDTTLIPMMVCLRIYDGQWPPFMSNLIIELYKEKETDLLFNRVIYNGKVQTIKISEETCKSITDYDKLGIIPYNDFESLLNKYSFPDNIYSSACDKALKLFTSGKPMKMDQYI